MHAISLKNPTLDLRCASSRAAPALFFTLSAFVADSSANVADVVRYLAYDCLTSDGTCV